TTYTYDVQDHLKTVTDAEGNLTTYTYSDRDLLTHQVSPVSGTTSHTYNQHGELLTTTDARAIVTTRTVDVLDRVTSVSYSDGTPGTGYAYDVGPFGKGRLSSITRSGQAIQYGYDRFGRLTQGRCSQLRLRHERQPDAHELSEQRRRGLHARLRRSGGDARLCAERRQPAAADREQRRLRALRLLDSKLRKRQTFASSRFRV
ncbi:MAG TPA: hypothetical protein VN493_09655, partial [Thermoanaerobaculia bacterium]|nr:hypothetical protein [Thermoanaerobaculia bacterium]